jgi:cation diffusion facilitator CzcD-associated flavoprotein CzcO
MESEHFNVLIVGAGLSGIGAACRLETKCPGKSYVILEARERIGGTWDLFRYPGIRSDSDMYTLGYDFKPWIQGKAIADGESIRRYIGETATEYGVDSKIRFGHQVVRAAWSTETSRWTVEATVAGSGESLQLTCDFLYMCSGYYRYDEGFSPRFEGTERFQGQIIHPQHWPEDLDYDGQRVVVIGSGATAVTLVPAMAERAEHVTMLQRSPSYIVSLPAQDSLAEALRKRLPDSVAYSIVRWKNVLLQMGSYQLSRRRPELMKALVRRGIARNLPPDYDIDTHFNPRYDPWDQRLCLVPDGDLFEAISSGSASIVTETIETFTENGIRLGSGDELEADIIVTATGLNLQLLGGVTLEVDGETVDFPQTTLYKGLMLSGVPNMALTVGYSNASWTLKADLVSDYVCRLLRYMDERGFRECRPIEPAPELPRIPALNLKSGYVLRALDSLPKQVEHPPWGLHQNYARDIGLLKRGEIDDGTLEFSIGARAPAERQLAAA